jgi:hypothetical protein
VAAIIKGAAEQEHMNNALEKSSNFAGTTRGQMLELAKSISSVGDISLGTAKHLVTDLVGSGKIGVDALSAVAGVAAQYARVTGEDVKKLGPELVKLFEDPVKGAEKLNESLHFLTIAQYDHLEALTRAGEKGKAQLELADALKSKFDQQEQNLGILTRAWRTLANAAGLAWDAMLDIGRKDTPEQAMARQKQLIEEMQRKVGTVDPATAAMGEAAGAGVSSVTQADVERAKEQLALMARNLSTQQQMAEQSGRNAEAEEKLLAVHKAGEHSLNNQIALIKEQIAFRKEHHDELRRSGETELFYQNAMIGLEKQLESLQNRGVKKDHGPDEAVLFAQTLQQQEALVQKSLENRDKLQKQAAASEIKDIQFLEKMRVYTATEAYEKIAKVQEGSLTESLTINQKELDEAQKTLDSILGLTGRNAAADAKLQADAVKLEKDIQALKQKRIELENALGETQKRNAQAAELAQKAEQDAIAKSNELYGQFIDKLNQESTTRKQQIAEVALTAEAQAALNAARKTEGEITSQVNKMELEALVAQQKGNKYLEADIRRRIELLKNETGAYTQRSADEAAALVRAKEEFTLWKTAIGDAEKGLANFFDDLITNGSAAFKNLWDNFKKWAFQVMAQVAAHKIIVSLIGDNTGLTSQLSGAAGLLGGGGGLGNIFGLVKNGIGLFGDSAGTSLAALFGPEFVTGAESISAGFAAAGAGAEAAVGFGTEMVAAAGLMEGVGATLAAAIPVVGWIAGAALLAWQIFGNKGGAPKAGGFASTGDISGIRDTDNNGRYFTPNQSDPQLTKTLEGVNKAYIEASKALGLTVGKIGFALGFDTDPGGTAPNRTHSAVFKDGQQIYNNAQGDLGRDEKTLQDAMTLEVKRILFAAIQSSLGDAPNYMKALFQGIDATTATSDQIDTILAEAQALKLAVDTVAGLGDKLNGLDPEQIKSLIDAFGGIDNFSAAFKFLNDNFTTSAQKMDALKTKMTADFDALGVKVPENHKAFLDLVNGIDLTTEAGRTLYASLVALSPEFIAVNGTAEDAAKALVDAQKALEEFTKDKFFTDKEKHDAAADSLTADLNALGVTIIPKTHAEFLKLINSLGLSDKQILELSQLFVEVNGTAQDAADAVQALADKQRALAEALASFHSQFDSPEQKIEAFWTQVHNAWTKFGGQILQAGLGDHIPTTTAGFRDLVTQVEAMATAEKDASGPMHLLLEALLSLAPAVSGLNAELDKAAEAAQRAADAEAELAYNRSAAGATAIQDQFGTIMSSINEIVDQSGGDFGSKLALTMKLIPEQIAKLQFQLEEAYKKGDIYGPLPTQLKTLIAQLQGQSAKAGTELARYTVLAAQYDAARAEQLLKLEEWFADMKAAIGDSPEALAALQIQFDTKWKAIVDGVADGANGVADSLASVYQSIRDFIDSLKQSDLSPLNPKQKLELAQEKYLEILAKAQGGDKDALSHVTEAADAYLKAAREFYFSSPDYTKIFDSVIAALEALVPSSGKPGEAGIDPVAAALPETGKLASSTNVENMTSALLERLSETTKAMIETNTTNTDKQIAAMNQRMDALIDKVGATTK